MILASLLLVALQDPVQALLQQRQFLAAWQSADAETSIANRARGKAEILLEAGDPAGALAEAKKGLLSEPSNLELLFHETTATLWLGDGQAAEESVHRLTLAVERASLGEQERAAWETAANQRLKEARGLQTHEHNLEHATARSRQWSLLVLAAAVVASALVLRSGSN